VPRFSAGRSTLRISRRNVKIFWQTYIQERACFEYTIEKEKGPVSGRLVEGPLTATVVGNSGADIFSKR
jgi:hypothetical protein